jgi:hypothetical protein
MEIPLVILPILSIFLFFILLFICKKKCGRFFSRSIPKSSKQKRKNDAQTHDLVPMEPFQNESTMKNSLKLEDASENEIKYEGELNFNDLEANILDSAKESKSAKTERIEEIADGIQIEFSRVEDVSKILPTD